MHPDLEEFLNSLIEGTYREKIEKYVKSQRNYFDIDFNDLSSKAQNPLRTNYVREKHMGTTMDDYITSVFNKILFESKGERLPPEEKIVLFFYNITPKMKIREIMAEEINGLMEINGTVISVTPPFNIIKNAVYKCKSCGELQIVIQTTNDLEKPMGCGGKCKSTQFTLIETESSWDDYQEIIIQENPAEVQAGNIPRTIRGKLLGKQLVDITKPGNLVNISCSLVPIPSRKKGRARVFDRILDINYIDVLSKESFSVELEEGDIAELKYLSELPNFKERFLDSIFPSIWGKNEVKHGLVLTMFGGSDEKKQDITRRGTINTLMLGDPGIGKSRLMQGVMSSVPKGVLASGRGASGVGLTAAAINDPLSGWILAAGAVVLADLGVCCVDEIDKMGNEDREKLHECMSTQTVTIHKANIHATLNSRTSIIGAANPKGGKYDSTLFVTDNIDLPITILSRFDLIFIMKDEPNEEEDEAIVNRVFEEEETFGYDLIPTELVKKYILYSKTLHPKLTKEAIQKFKDYYIPLRKSSTSVYETPIAITVRQLEALKRIGQASARMRLSDMVTAEDAELAISLMELTLAGVGYDQTTGRRDIGVLEGKPLSDTTRKKQLLALLDEIADVVHTDVLKEMVEEEFGMTESQMEKALRALTKEGLLYCPKSGVFCHHKHVYAYTPE